MIFSLGGSTLTSGHVAFLRYILSVLVKLASDNKSGLLLGQSNL